MKHEEDLDKLELRAYYT